MIKNFPLADGCLLFLVLLNIKIAWINPCMTILSFSDLTYVQNIWKKTLGAIMLVDKNKLNFEVLVLVVTLSEMFIV